MKRCPECRRDYYDDTLRFCLADGAELVYGLGDDGAATAMLPDRVVPPSSEGATKPQINATAGPESQPLLNNSTESEGPSAHRAAHQRDLSRKFKASVVLGVAFLLVMCAAGFAIYKSGWQSKTPAITSQMKLARLTTTGKATVAAISPDGRYVVYAINDNGQQSLWMRQTATESNVQIVPPAADVNYSRLIFSPDGNYLFYTMAAERNVDDATLYQIPVLGGAPKKLISKISSFMALSPDALQIVFKREFAAEGIDTLMLANVDGSNERRLAVRKMPESFFEVGGARSAPAWSPDGQTIACRVTNLDGRVVHQRVVAIDVATGQETPISSQEIYGLGEVVWLNDQSGLIMLAADEQGGRAQLWHLSYPDGEARRITNDFNNYRSISLTADSTKLVTVQLGRTSSIWATPSNDVTRAQQLTNGAGRSDYTMRWTPDNKILFDSTAGGLRDIWIMDADGGNQKQLTSEGAFGPSVSPDGRYISFRSNREGLAHIFRSDADGANVKRLTNGSGEFVPVFSPDGKWVLYNSRESGVISLWRVPVDGGEPQQLTESHAYDISVSPDGKWLTANYRDDEPNSPDKVAIFPFEGGQPVKTFENIPTREQRISWTVDSRTLIYIDTRGGVSNLWTQALDGGEPKQITDFKADRIFSYDYSRDGKQLALSRGSINNDVVMISNFK